MGSSAEKKRFGFPRLGSGMREQVWAGVAPAAGGAYRLVTVVMNGESLKTVKESTLLDGDTPPPGLKAGSPLVLALPRREVIVKTVQVPSSDRRQISQMAPYEAASQLPWPPEESQVAFAIHDSEEPEYSDLVLFMCRKETIQGHLAALKKWNLSPSRIEPAFLSAGRLLWHAEDEAAGFFVADRNGIEYARYARGRNLFSRGTPPEEDPAKVLARSRTIDERMSPGAPCTAVYVAGDAPLDLEELSGVAAPCAVKSVAELPLPSQVAPSDAVCVGAALGGADYDAGGNLLPEREMRLVVLRHIVRQGRKLLASAVWLLLVLVAMGWYFFSREEARATRAEAEIEAIQAEVGNLKEQYEALQLLAGERTRVGLPLQVVLELYRLTPQNIGINSFTYDSRRTLSFGGEAPSFRAAYEYMDALLNSKMLADVDMKSASKPQLGREELVEFKVTCAITGMK